MSGRFTISGVFAQGAQSVLYTARDEVTGDLCLLKTGSAVKEEALLSLELNHPYIARAFDFGTHPEIGVYAAYPKFSEPSLSEWKRNGSTDSDFKRVVLQIAEFLSFLHHRGWLYHDFKPEHFLIGEDSIRVLDLGLCGKIDQSHSSNTFSGTFPYISPERLAGRRCDGRSDIFGLGMMLLHMFYLDEDWSGAPSVAALQQLQKRSSDLEGFWKNLIMQMTSLEPSQRPETAHELWEKLVPEKAHGTFLLFPIPMTFSSADQIISDEERIVVAQSSSQLNLAEIETQLLKTAWNSNIKTIIFDFKNTTIEECFHKLATICGAKFQGFFKEIEFLEKLKLEEQKLIILRSPDALASSEKPLLSFALTGLSKSRTFHVLIETLKNFSILENGYKNLEVPPFSKPSLELIFRDILPPNGITRQRIDKIRAKGLFSPEQLLLELSKELPPEGFVAWPAIAKSIHEPPPLERLTKLEMRCLGFLALSGGSLDKERLDAVMRLTAEQSQHLLETLIIKGYAQSHDKKLHLNVPVEQITNRLRKDRIKQAASALLRSWPSGEEPRTQYCLARVAGLTRLAACLAIRQGRAASLIPGLNESPIWFYRAFSCGARLPKDLLDHLSNYYMRRAHIKKTERLLSHLRKRFKLSYGLVNKFLDLYHRTNKLFLGQTRVEAILVRAERKRHSRALQYFSAKLAGFLILQQRFEEGEEVLRRLPYRDSQVPCVRGLAYHFRGLSFLFRGKLKDSIKHFHEAVKFAHPFRSSSYMNLGIAWAQTGNYSKGERYIRKCVALFSRLQDSDRLAHAYNNLGMVMMESGKPSVARKHYELGLELSRATRNESLLVSSLSNLAETYRVEGRTDRVINLQVKAARIATRSGLKARAALCLTNAGLQYIIKGRIPKAISCLRAGLSTRKSLKLDLDLGFSYEYLGIAFFFSKHLSSARKYFDKAHFIFTRAGSASDKGRLELYQALIFCETQDYDNARTSLHSRFLFREDSFEVGLFNYVSAYLSLSSPEFNKDKCRETLYNAECIFRKIPDLFWLARLLKLKAEYLVTTDHYESAVQALQSAYNIFSRLGARKELFELAKFSDAMMVPENLLERISERLPYKVLMMIKQVLSERNPDSMISKILSCSVEFTNMERAVLILSGEPARIYKSTTLDDSAIEEIREISKSATDEAAELTRPYIRLDASSDPHLKSKPSIIANRIMSIVCLPLHAGERVIGVLYLDSKERMEALASTETVLLEIFASIIGLALNNTLILERSLAENEDLRASLGLAQFPEIIATSEPMLAVLKTVHQLLETEIPVLITGETGTGKELIARVLHFCGQRKNGAFVAVNCSTLSKSLLESELFGHEKGSFTGAIQTKKGLFEQARHGTLFLDEIGEMPYSMQAKLLRVLQEGEFRRVGGNEELRTDARIVLATNRNLQELVKANKFREDLYYRIKGVQIHLPSLKERPQDIPLLASHFLKSAVTVARKKILGLTPEALELLKSYDWPGNVRQLKNEIERVVALTNSEWIHPGEFSSEIQEVAKTPLGKEGTLREKEKEIILERLHENKWNIFHTAKSLGLTRNGLYGKMKLHGIPRKLIQ